MLGGKNLEKIQRLGQKRNAKKILPFVNSKKADERAAAAKALGYASDDDSCNALITLLRDPEMSVRINAAGALKIMRRGLAVEHLRQAGRNSTDEAFKAACSDAVASIVSRDKNSSFTSRQ